MTMATHLGERLQQLRVAEPLEAGGLQVFGLYWDIGTPVDYRTLDEALRDGVFEVTELSQEGSVPTLQVTNRGSRPVFLMAGEHLAGGKQNRVLNVSILVPGENTLPIPVSCVERRRWAYRSPSFAGSGSCSHSHLRRMMHKQVTFNLHTNGRAAADQAAVWQEVHRKLNETGSHSSSEYLDKAYEDSEPLLREVAEQMPAPQDACGAVFAYGGEIIGFDLFDRPGILQQLWSKLIRAYIIDARAAKKNTPVTTNRVQEWLQGIAAARQQIFKSPGLGEDVRLESAHLSAAALAVEGHPVHVEAFAQAS